MEPSQILHQLTTVSRELSLVAAAWHAFFLVAAIALVSGFRPSKRLAARLLLLPLISAGIIADAFGNGFNTTVLLLLSLLLLMIAIWIPVDKAIRGPPLATAAGIILVLFALVYPHFLDPTSAILYAAFAPVGLIPCPTLAAVLGFTLIASGFGSRAWSLSLASVAFFYGAFGWLRLHVAIDAVLVAGALVLAAEAVLNFRQARSLGNRRRVVTARRPAIPPGR